MISPYPGCVIDTDASSHMTNNLDLCINFKTIKDTVKLSDNSVIERCGCGIVVILAKTSLCHVFSLYLERVLWVPSYGWFTLLSWRTIVPSGRDFLWLVPEKISQSLWKINQKLS